MTLASLWDDAPCGLLLLARDGTVEQVNRTVLAWTGRPEDELRQAGFGVLLAVGGRIYWETHLRPLLHLEGRLDEVALDLRTADGRLPVLMTAIAAADGAQVHVALSSARERTTYERELLLARRAADLARDRLASLQGTTSALSRAVGIEAVAAALADAAVGPLGGTAASVWSGDPGSLVLRAARGPDPDGPPGGRHHGGGTTVLDDGRVLVPLPGPGGLRGLWAVTPGDAAVAGPLDLELLTAVGRQGGLALERAELYEHDAGVASQLQASLLAADPPVDPRYEVATAYRAGIERLQVGGDWHDVFLVDDGLLGIVVGDVVGRGLAAASAMGQLRSAVRAVAAPGLGPGRLLTRLDRFVEQVDAASMATLAYAELELGTGRLRYACAGHPPPLLLPADGVPRLLWDGRSTPLGALGRPQERPEGELVLSPADRLLLCTDGLFERRDRDLDVGLEVLARAAEGVQDLPAARAVGSLTATLLADEVTRDDVCVLLLGWRATDFVRHVRADLQDLSRSRVELGAWLHGQGLAADVVDDLVLAASEALANAAEHGSGLLPDTWVRLRGAVDDDDVELVVQDRGRWRGQGSGTPERGRGLQLARALVDTVDVLPDDTGTRVVLRRARAS